MKAVYYIFILNLFLALGCDKYPSGTFDDENTLNGKWQLTEAFISSGGPRYWVDVEDGEEIEFFANGSFVSNRFSECSAGDFSMESNQLFLKYSCDGFEVQSENQDGFISYDLKFESNYFIATPTSGPICIEGCSYKFSKN